MTKSVKLSSLMATMTVAIMLFAGCKKSNNNEPLESGSFNGRISATVESGGAVVVVAGFDIEIIGNELKGRQVAESNYSNGGFSFVLPDIPDQYLKDIDKFFEKTLLVTGKLTYSNKDAKIVHIDFLGFDKDDYLVGYYIYASSDRSTLCYFVYVNKDVDVTGGKNIKVSLKEGWNRIYYSEAGEGMVTTKAQDGMKWHFREPQPTRSSSSTSKIVKGEYIVVD